MKHFLSKGKFRRNLMLTAAMLTGISSLRAQTAADYLFSGSSGAYTPVSSSATEVSGLYADTYISPAQNIGFTFTYEGAAYTQFKISSNGFISLNMGGTTALTTNNLSTANATSRPIIAPLWDDLDGRATGNVSYAGYELTGSAPNRVLTVEWRNWEWNYAASNPVISFQVKLYETTNVIEFVYRQESGAVNSGSASIGIGSATGSGNGSYLNVTGLTAPIAAGSTTSVTTISTKPDNNQVFTFTPPQACSGDPAAGTAAATAACSGGPVNLSLTGATLAQGITIQWQESTAPNVWNDISGANATTYTATYTPSVQYRAKVTCSATPTPAYSNEVTPVSNPAYACYCSPLSGQQLHTNTGNYITNVAIANTTLSNATTAAGTGGYTRNYPTTATTTASLLQGVNYNLTVTLSAATYTGKVWIDYDHSGTFDAAEATTIASGTTVLSIPATALAGLTGMRVRAANATPYTNNDACANLSTGYETEDYIINILANQTCTGTPATAGTAAVDKDTLCLSGNVILSLAGYPLELGTSINWQVSPAGANNFTDISGANTEVYTVTGLNASSDFRARATCASPGGGSTFSNVLHVVVNNPTLTSTVPGSRCDPGNVALYAQASNGGQVNWYSSPSGGTALATGNVFVTPSLSSTTPFYAAPANAGGGISTAALPNAISTSNYTLEAGLYFNALTDFHLDGAYVYPTGTGAGTVVFALQDGSVTPAVTLQSITVNLTGSAAPFVRTYVPLNFTVPAGTSYKLMMISRSGGVSGLIRESGTSWGSYPLTTPGIVSITNGNCCSGNALSTSYYYLYDWQISTGCEGPRSQVDAVINSTAGATGLASGGTIVSGNQADGTTISYDASCADKVAVIADAAGGNTLGNTSATVLVTPTVQTYNGMPYVPRVYDITPQNNGAATVTIYVLQSEFDAYNTWVSTNNPSLPLLPVSAADPNVNNIVLTQWHGNFAAGNAGPGGVYAGPSSFITNASVTATTNGTYWTLTFPVTGFSGFYVHTGTLPLPVGLTSVNATNAGKRNRVDWLTADEKEMQVFGLQRSSDAREFTDIARLNASGHADSYSYWDEQPFEGINYYRLKIYDKNGQFSFSKVVKAFVNTQNAFMVEAYPNPVSSQLVLKISGTRGGNAGVWITDITGKAIKSVKVHADMEQIDMSSLTSGTYLIKYADDHHTQTLKVNKL